MIEDENNSCLVVILFWLIFWPCILLWKLIKWAVFKIFNIEE